MCCACAWYSPLPMEMVSSSLLIIRSWIVHLTLIPCSTFLYERIGWFVHLHSSYLHSSHLGIYVCTYYVHHETWLFCMWSKVIDTHMFTSMYQGYSNPAGITCLLGQPWVSPTLAWLHCARVYVWLFAWTDHLPQISNQCIQVFHEDRYRAWSMWKPVEACQSVASAIRSKDDWS